MFLTWLYRSHDHDVSTGNRRKLRGLKFIGHVLYSRQKAKHLQFILFHNNTAKKKNTTNIPQARKSLKKVRLLYIHTHRSYVYVSLKGQRKENRSHCPMTSEPGTNGFLVLSSFNKAKMSKWLAYYF